MRVIVLRTHSSCRPRDWSVDAREGDHYSALGAAVGLDLRSRPAFFLELRYERWFERGITRFVLPTHVLSAVVGLTTR